MEYLYSLKSQLSIELLPIFKTIAKPISLDDINNYRFYKANYPIKYIPALIDISKKLYDGEDLYNWIMKNKDPEDTKQKKVKQDYIQTKSLLPEKYYELIEDEEDLPKTKDLYFENQEMMESKPKVKLDARSLKNKQISSSAEELMRERENIESKFTNSRKITKQPETILLDD